jgi:hypothetical protein
MSRSIFIVACTLGAAMSATSERVFAAADVLATVRITAAVMADGKPLPSGTYELRLEEGPGACPCESPDVQRWVEFVADGKVVGREIAQVLRDDKLPATGASSKPVPNGTRVELLKGGEFLRVSIKRERERYLIYLPVTS